MVRPVVFWTTRRRASLCFRKRTLEAERHYMVWKPAGGAANGGADLVQVRRDEGEQRFLRQHQARRKDLCQLSGVPSATVAQPPDRLRV